LGNVAITGNISANIATFGAGSNTAPSITTTGDTNTGIFFPAADTIAFTEGGVESMRIDSAGNMGLGVTPSAWGSIFRAMQIGSDGAWVGGRTDSQNQAWLGTNAYYNGTNWIYKASTTAGQLAIAGNTFSFYQAASGTAGNTATFTQAMTLDASGNLGIGTSSPAYKLDVSGDRARIVNTGVAELITSSSGGGGNWEFGVDASGNGFIYSGQSKYLAVSTSGSERMRITSAGDLLVGTTTSRGRITCEAASGDLITGYTTSTSTGYVYNSTSATVSNAAYFVKAGTEAGKITVVANSTTYATSSDYRLKENIEPITGALAKVDALKPCTYTWKNTGEASEGFIAHELAEVCPQAVVGEKDAVYEDGSINPQGIDTSFLIATLTAAIQEQQALITTLTDRITALEAK
jgi:hypothetical protein